MVINDIKKIMTGVQANNNLNWNCYYTTIVDLIQKISLELGDSGTVTMCAGDKKFADSIRPDNQGYAKFNDVVLGTAKHSVVNWLKVTVYSKNISVAVAIPVRYDVKYTNNRLVTLLAIDGKSAYIVYADGLPNSEGQNWIVSDVMAYVQDSIENHSDDKERVWWYTI